MNKKATSQLDKEIGARVRLRRLQCGMSQEKLAEALGLTFQQVQKYEKGANRITVSRLDQIAKALDTRVEAFLPGGDFSAQGGTPVPNDRESRDLLSLFGQLQSRSMRKAVVSLVRAAVGEQQED